MMLSGGSCFQSGKSLANRDPESVKQKNAKLTVAMSYEHFGKIYQEERECQPARLGEAIHSVLQA